MKTAKSHCDSFTLACPHCDGLLQSPGGSLVWSWNETYPESAPCADCQTVSKTPNKIPSLTLRTPIRNKTKTKGLSTEASENMTNALNSIMKMKG